MSEISPQNLSDVAETLLMMLYIRAVESQRPDALIKDERAVALVRRMDQDFLRDKLAQVDEETQVAVGQPTITRTDTWFEGGIVWYRNQIIKRRFKQCPLASGSV